MSITNARPTEQTVRLTAVQKYTLIVAMAIHESMQRRIDEYAADVDEWYRAGDGRPRRFLPVDDNGNVTPGLQTHYVGFGNELWPYRTYNFGGEGHAYPVCIHDMNLWVDHDIPCGACEFADDRPLMVQALDEARELVDKWSKRADAYIDVIGAANRTGGSSPMPIDHEALHKWVNAPIEEWLDAAMKRRRPTLP